MELGGGVGVGLLKGPADAGTYFSAVPIVRLGQEHQKLGGRTLGGGVPRRRLTRRTSIRLAAALSRLRLDRGFPPVLVREITARWTVPPLRRSRRAIEW